MHQTDLHVGRMLKLRRSQLGISQKDLGNQIGVKFQQIQKYEMGTNRVSASRLHDISKALSVDVSYFFQNIEANESEEEENILMEIDVFHVPNSLRLLKAFCSINNSKLQYEIIELVEAISMRNI